MPIEIWTDVDALINPLVGEDDALRAAHAATVAAGIPDIRVTASQGRLISILAKLVGARRILEIGTLGGYSTIWLARALPEGGSLITLELEPHHAEVARANIDAAGVGDRVEIRLGRAAASLEAMVSSGEGPFDFIFVDADKPSNPIYLDYAIRLARPGTLIFVDNVIRNGKVADPGSTDPNVVGVRRMFEAIPNYPNLEVTAVQTVGEKGYDGFCLLRVSE